MALVPLPLGMVLVPVEGPRACEHGTASKVSRGDAFYTLSPSDTYLGRFRYHLHRIHAVTLWHAYFWNEVDSKCIQKEVRRVLVFRTMRVLCTATAVLTPKRSILRPTIALK